MRPSGGGSIASRRLFASSAASATSAATASAGTASAPSAPFTQCPAIGSDSGCGLLIDITDTGAVVYGDPTQGPFDGIEDTLIGVVNDSSKTMGALALTSSTDLFGFDGDGLCAFTACNWPAPTGYEGPNTSFSGISSDYSGGVVNFPAGLTAGATTYFSLEESLSTSNVATGSGQSAVTPLEVGQSPNPREQLPGCSTKRPVNCATGAFWHTFEDLQIAGRGPGIDVQRTYSSLLHDSDSPFGYGWSSPYAMSLSVAPNGDVTVHQENGSSIGFTASAQGFTAPSRVLASLAQNAGGDYTLTDFRGGLTHTFDAGGRLLSIGDRNGETTTLSYTAGVLSGITDAAGRTVAVSEDPNGHITGMTDPAGRTMGYAYNSSGDLTAMTDVRGGTWAFTYDTSHQMLTMTDPRGGTVTNTYDTAGRVTTQTDPMGRSTTFAFSGDPTSTAGGTTTITDPPGKVTVETYQQLQLQTITHGAGTSDAARTTFSYDPFTLGLASRTDPNGNTTTFAYDRRGNLLTRTDPLGRSTNMSWNGMNELTSTTTPAGHATTYGYDSTGNLLSVARALSGTSTQATQLQHNNPAHPGDVTALIDPDGYLWSYGYDTNGDLTEVTDPLGDVSAAAYDQVSRKTASTTPRGKTTTYDYDPANELTKITTPTGATTQFGYNANGDQNSTTDANGNQTTTTFDADDEPVTVTRADHSTLTYGYDNAGNQVSQTNGAGKQTTYGYDALNRVTSVVDPLARTTTYAYDAAGNRTAITNPNGKTTTYTYDAANQLTGIAYADPATPDVSYTYDPDGLRATMADGTGTSHYTYDALARLVATSDGAGTAVGYGYDLANRTTSIAYPGTAKTVTRGFDAAGRLTSVTDWNNHATTFAYNADGDLTSEQYPNGVTATLTRDANGAVTNIADNSSAGTTLATFGYSRDANSQITGETSTGTGQATQAYTYNPLNQLASRNGNTYSYNTADDLIRLATGATVSYDGADEATSYTDSTGKQTSLGYDSDGNRLDGLTPDGTKVSYGYDRANRLTTATVHATGAVAQAVVSAGANHTLAIAVDGSLRAWGANTAGQLGDGTTSARATPITVPGLTGVTGTAAGYTHSVAITSGGAVWAWGSNDHGQLGDGSTTEHHSPTAVAGLTGTIAGVAAGNGFTLALRSDGTVYAWGANDHGQLGDGTTTEHHNPTLIPALTNVIAVAASQAHAVALKSDGTVWAWGSNNAGQLGDGTSTDRHTPVRSGTLSNIVQISVAANGHDTFALTSTGTVYGWGGNGSGQLGDGTTTTRTQPTPVSGLSKVAAVAAGSSHTLAVTTDGTAYAWGLNDHGQLGDGTTIDHATAAVVPGLTATGIAAGTNHSIAINTDGTLDAWGLGTSGQLGNGTLTDSHTTATVNGVTVSHPATASTTSTYGYDGDGLRVSASTGNDTNAFTWDITAPVPLLLTDATRDYLYGPGAQPIEQITIADDTTQYLHCDQYGSTRLITDNTGAVAGTYAYTPYGQLESHTGTADTPLRWNGQYEDLFTGLYYLLARYYDELTGSFLTLDPIVALTHSPHQFGHGNPLNEADPTGLGCGFFSPQDCIVDAADAVADAVSTGASAAYNDVLEPVGSTIASVAGWIGDHPVGTALIAGGVVLVVAGGVFAVAFGGATLEALAAAEAGGAVFEATTLLLKVPFLTVLVGGSPVIAGGVLVLGGIYRIEIDEECQ